MAKKPNNLNEKTMRERENAAYKTLVDQAVDWDTLRARARNRLSGLMLSREDIGHGRADHSLMLLAALWHITPRSMRTSSFPETRIRQFGGEVKETVPVHQLFPPIAVRRACVVAASLEQSLLVIKDHLGELLTGNYYDKAVWRYTSLPISQAIPNFWPHIYGILGNIAITRHATLNGQELDLNCTVDLLANSVRHYFATHGLADSLKIDDMNVVDDVTISLFLTDDLRGLRVRSVPLFRNIYDTDNDSGYASAAFDAIESPYRNVTRPDQVDPDVDDEEDDFDDVTFLSAYLTSKSENAPDVNEIRGVFLPQVDGTPVVQTIQFRNTSKSSLFQDVEDLASIGFSIVWRTQEHCVRNLLPRELLELSAALYEVAEIDIPSDTGSMGPQPVRATRARKTKARKLLSRTDMANQLIYAGVKHRSALSHMTDDEVRELYNSYKSRDSDI
ncbi:hypothetical protein pEaSNUABM5_00304 [Erwinia phage pEa_SNUABM_5]|uniref:Uncharacterized protein n=1 Tax=Erwinia phage pEa_SNUABM_5 TaxID=2797313 RepID=A0A7T8EPU0_9CAUD|nr:hypothetical protein MPK73_gp304 [Erwinia phage pEa_SNUABM_5]QQO90446.1 hypothetical protein pEaSNUABM5_00304 [Erwinia phage pEa_SNUABM_5]